MVETTTLIVLMTVALVVMAVVVGALVVRLIHKNEELKEKNDVIVREVRRNQTLIDRAVQQGVSRAAMLSFSLLLLVGCVSVLTSCTKDDETIYTPDPTDAPRTSPLVMVVYSPDGLQQRR
jgi:putative Mn2+ efflux pump MntP